MSKLTDSEKVSLLNLAKQYQYTFKTGSPNYQKIELHIRRCLANNQEPVEIKPVQKRKVDIGYYRYLSDSVMENGFITGGVGRVKISVMKRFLYENNIKRIS